IADFLRCPSGCTNPEHGDDVEAGDLAALWGGSDPIKSRRADFNKGVAHLSRTRGLREVVPVRDRVRMARVTLEELAKYIAFVDPPYQEWFGDIRDALLEAKQSRAWPLEATSVVDDLEESSS